MTSDNKNNMFVSGDKFEGIIVSEPSDAQYHFNKNNISVDVIQKISRSLENRLCLGFLFRCSSPIRFRIDVKIPEECKNAMVTLNDYKLIGYFSNDIPKNPEYFLEDSCKDHNAISTLRPGEFQSINFLWQAGDVLKFFFYY